MDTMEIFLFGHGADAPASAPARKENHLSLFNLGITDTQTNCEAMRKAWFQRYMVKGEPVRSPTERDRIEVDSFLRKYRGYTGPKVRKPKTFHCGARLTSQGRFNELGSSVHLRRGNSHDAE